MKKIMLYLIIIISFSFNMAFAFDFNNMQKITYFAIDKTEISIEQFSILPKPQILYLRLKSWVEV